MENLIVILLIILFIVIPAIVFYKKEEQQNEKVTQDNKMIKEFEKTYRSFDTEQIEEELKKMDKDYNNLVEQARRVYIQKFSNEDLFDVLGYDRSEYIRWEIDSPLCARRFAMENIIEKREKYGDNIHASNYSISSKIQYEDKNGKKRKIKYTATIDFDLNYKIAFFYGSDIKNVIPKLKMTKYFDIRYDDIKSVEVKDNCLVFKVENSEYWKNFIPKNINYDFKEVDDYLCFELETETPLEIKKIIDRIIKGTHQDD